LFPDDLDFFAKAENDIKVFHGVNELNFEEYSYHVDDDIKQSHKSKKSFASKLLEVLVQNVTVEIDKIEIEVEFEQFRVY